MYLSILESFQMKQVPHPEIQNHKRVHGELNYHQFHMTLGKEMCNSDSINETLSYRRQYIGLSKLLHNTKPLSYLVAD